MNYPARGLALLLLMAALLLSGCAALAARQGSAKPGQPVNVGTVSEATLRSELDDFRNLADETIRDAADRISLQTTDSVIRRRTVVWKLYAIPAIRHTSTKRDPRQALLDMWVFSARMHIYFAEGPGRAQFGAMQPVAVNAAGRVRQGVEDIAARLLPQERFAAVRDAVESYARASAFSAIAMEEALRLPTASTPSLGPFSFIVGIPLSPFTAASGISQGAQAIQDFTVVASRLTDVAADLPEESRWQADLLLLDIEELNAVAAALQDFNKVAEGLKQLSIAAGQLPADVETRITRTLDEINARQAEIQKTLSEFADAAKAWETTIRAIGETFGLGAERKPQAAPSAPHKPFDINDYATAAEHVDKAAAQVTALLSETRLTLESTDVARRLAEVKTAADATVAKASLDARGVVDHAAWCVAGLLVLAFVLALAYRLVSSLIIARRAKG